MKKEKLLLISFLCRLLVVVGIVCCNKTRGEWIIKLLKVIRWESLPKINFFLFSLRCFFSNFSTFDFCSSFFWDFYFYGEICFGVNWVKSWTVCHLNEILLLILARDLIAYRLRAIVQDPLFWRASITPPYPSIFLT